MSVLTPETFSLSRQLEYFSESELTKQIGYPRDLWLLAMIKEAVDNALDNCEENNILPDVKIKLGNRTISVSDNGTGIPAETVKAMLNFDRRVSSREAYRCPTRGAQGNAGKCILGCTLVLNGDHGRVTIVAQGCRHEIIVTLDQLAQQPRIKYSLEEEKVQTGTTVELHIDELACLLDADEIERFVLFARTYSVLNPHLSLSLELPDGTIHAWNRACNKINKWTAGEPVPASWYDVESFERLIGASISRDRENGTDRTLRDFLRQFSGLRRSDALKAITVDTELNRCSLSALANCEGLDRQKTSSLLYSIQQYGATPKPQKLGCIGRDNLKRAISQFEILGEFKYKKIVDNTDDGLPFVVECAFAELSDAESDALIITGCNFSPSIDLPIVRDLDYLLAKQMIEDDSAIVLLFHIIAVAPTYLDRGKSHIDIQGNLEEAVFKCVESSTRNYCRQQKADERDALRVQRRLERRERSRPAITLKDAIILVLPNAIYNASGGGVCDFSDRDLYYAARELVQAYTNQPLSQSYFDRVVDEWEIENGLIEGRLRDPRGFLLEPHTGNRIPLGTKSVDEYQIPLHLFDTIIYVEKKGLLAKFEYGQIGNKYDCAIIAAEGYAPRAAKTLLQAAQHGHKMKVLCFHDADPDGYNIARTLSNSTGANNFDIKVVDVGLHIEEAVEMGLAVEMFVRKKALPNGLEFSDTELEYFEGRPIEVDGKNGRPKVQYVDCRRVELNALSSNPPRFIEWIESKLELHGVAKKLVPPKNVIKERSRQKRDEILTNHIWNEFIKKFEIENKVEQIANKIVRKIKISSICDNVIDWAKDPKPEHWTQCVDDKVTHAVGQVHDAIRLEIARMSPQ